MEAAVAGALSSQHGEGGGEDNDADLKVRDTDKQDPQEPKQRALSPSELLLSLW